jgi:formylglycine-generating enzyme required for sulfatase activity
VYALGLLLYHALTGQMPYGVEGPLRQVLDNIMSAEPAPPSALVSTPGLGAAANAVVLKALAKSPSGRHATAAELATDLAALSRGEPTVTRPHLKSARGALRRLASIAVGAIIVGGLALILGDNAVESERSLGNKQRVPTAAGHAIGAAVRPPPFSGPKPARLASPRTAGHGSDLQTGDTDIVGLRFAHIPAGAFRMGSPVGEPRRQAAEESRHRVRITRPFEMSTTEVTQAQYEWVMGEAPWDPRSADPDRPAEEVSWHDAVEFCRRLTAVTGLTYRLPTEAEWEYACRAGADGTVAGPDAVEGAGWCLGNTDGRTHAVGEKQPNAWGLYDMQGNVREWCSDYYEQYHTQRTAGGEVDVDPTGSPSGLFRVARGGSVLDSWDLCRPASRIPRDAELRARAVGFRVVRDLALPLGSR